VACAAAVVGVENASGDDGERLTRATDGAKLKATGGKLKATGGKLKATPESVRGSKFEIIEARTPLPSAGKG
jgi:hypothetical protein